VHVVEALPTNASGKVLKTELRARFGEEPAPDPVTLDRSTEGA
jgi:acyl-coenzyme A synthetase/AMP-(fatty) acid ligase